MKINFDDLTKRGIYLKDKIYDYIIIGSGPAGISLYKKILSINKNKKILILEEGDFQKKKFKKILSKDIKIKLKSRAFTAGGTSTVWSNISSYFEEFEMDSRWSGEKGNLWPIKQKDLLKEYKNLDKEYLFSYEKLKKVFLNIPFETRPFVGSIKPTNFKQFINPNQIDIVYNCKIDSVDENQKIALALTKKKINFKAKKIIVCCGGIESVCLIKNSIYKKKLKKIKNKNIIGKYFMDHPKFDLGYLKFPKLDIINKLVLKNEKNMIFYHGVSLRKNIQKKNNLLNSYVRFEQPQNKLFRFINRYNVPFVRNILLKNMSYKVRLFCEMLPNINNSIIIKNNKVLAKLSLSETDRETIKLLSKKIKNYFSHRPREEGDFNFDNMKSLIEGASHHMGGLRYSNNKNFSNVDKNLRIRGLRHIYVCSSAIFPTSGSVNPTMTICALSNRLAEHLNK